MIATTEGTLLGGRVRYVQPASGFRSGLEPVLLAAAVPARPGQRVLEGGSGAGAALLCLSARVLVHGLGIETGPELTALARANAAANGFSDLRFEAADLLSLSAGTERYEHAFANPPYHLGGTPSPVAARDGAKRTDRAGLREWIAALARRLEPGGSLSLIVSAASLGVCVAAVGEAACGSLALHPFWPRAGEPAKLVLVHAVRGGRAGARMLPGLTLHGADGAFTPQADAVLRGGEALRLQPERGRPSDRLEVHVP